MEAVDQFGAGHADRAGNAVRMVFLVGTAVEDREPALLLALRQFLGADPRGAVFVLDDFGESLARHMDAAIDREPCRRPRRHPAGQHRDIAPAAFDQPRRGALGKAARSAVIIANDDRRRASRQQAGRDQLQPAQGQARRHQQMPLMKAPLLAWIDDRDLPAIVEPAAQFRRSNAPCAPPSLSSRI